jgi:hypothetical protein
MMWLMHFDWGGNEKQLKEFDDLWKKIDKKLAGVKVLGRMSPWNKKYHFTIFTEIDDISKVMEFNEHWSKEYNRDYGVLTHVIYEFYS